MANAGACSGGARSETAPSLLAIVMLEDLWLIRLAILRSKLAIKLFNSLLLQGRGLRHSTFRFGGDAVSESESPAPLSDSSDMDSSDDIKSTVRHGIYFLLSSSEIVVDCANALQRFTRFYKRK